MSYGQKSYKSIQIPQIKDLYGLKQFVKFIAKRSKKKRIMWQEIVTFLIIIATAVYTVVKFLKNLRNGGGDCGCGGGKNCRSKKK